MATSGVTISQNGGQGSIKLHPHVLALLRWCISCVWSAASELLQRLMAAPLPPITSALKHGELLYSRRDKRWSLKKTTGRQASREHISPVPKVECVVLHEPRDNCNMDIVFVHGLYGSLGNTWRQGDWKRKYKWGPNRIPIKRPGTIPTACPNKGDIPISEIQINLKGYDFCMCGHNDNKQTNGEEVGDSNQETGDMNTTTETIDKTNLNDRVTDKFMDDNDIFITDNIYEKDFMESVEILDNYEAQANFVRDLFRSQNCDNQLCDNETALCDCGKCKSDEKRRNMREINEECDEQNDLDDLSVNELDENDIKIFECEGDDCKCENDVKTVKNCPMGCGCVCEKCYSPCWPKDWLQVDCPDARIISINYTSDPYLWRPIWIKESKRLRLHERAEQMTKQLLDLGVGKNPIIWVGHSKGGLFIKEIYSKAYEAHMNCNGNKNETMDQKTQTDKHFDDNNIDFIVNNYAFNENNNVGEVSNGNGNKKSTIERENNITDGYRINKERENDRDKEFISSIENTNNEVKENNEINNFMEEIQHILQDIDINSAIDDIQTIEEEDKLERDRNNLIQDLHNILNTGNCEIKDILKDTGNDAIKTIDKMKDSEVLEDIDESERVALWSNSVGFMFYSVPHRGSSLADINVAPLMLRSVELLEISKDCSLVLDLQERWLKATQFSKPVVRSLVETCRTLMAILWLRIVSFESADAGIGALCGVSVDHREICKPSSRSCLLYTELLNLIHAALDRCRCH